MLDHDWILLPQAPQVGPWTVITWTCYYVWQLWLCACINRGQSKNSSSQTASPANTFTAAHTEANLPKVGSWKTGLPRSSLINAHVDSSFSQQKKYHNLCSQTISISFKHKLTKKTHFNTPKNFKQAQSCVPVIPCASTFTRWQHLQVSFTTHQVAVCVGL